MRKVLLFAMLLLPQLLVAQDVYHKFTENHKVWKYVMVARPEYDYEFYTDGDTIIGGQVSIKLFSNNYRETSGYYEGALYDEGTKTYFCQAGENEFKLLIDFSISVGDTLRNGYAYVESEKVEEKDEHSFRTLRCYHKEYDVESDSINSRYVGYLIEGIGSTGPYLLYPIYWSSWDWRRLAACFVDGKLIYHTSYYDPSKIEEINAPSSSHSFKSNNNAVYDLSGRRVANSSEFQGSSFRLPKGVYIQGGKKFVVK